MQELNKIQAEIKSALQKNSDDMAGITAKAAEERKAHGEALSETQGKLKDFAEKQLGLESKLDGVAQQLASQFSGGDNVKKSFGETVAGSDEYTQQFIANGSNNIKTSVDLRETKAAVTIGSQTSAGALISPERRPFIANDPMDNLVLSQLIPTIPTSHNSMEFAREDVFTNNAGIQANEGDAKPESEITFALETAQLKNIAHHINVSRQALEDVTTLQSYLENRMVQGLEQKIEDQLLSGDGAGNNFTGLFTAATAGTLTKTTIIDRISEALLAVHQQGKYYADVIVMSPVDWFEISIQKDANNRYLFANPQTMTAPMLWGRPVVTSDKVPAGEFMVGNLRQAAEKYVRHSVDVRLSDQHDKNFVSNLITLLVEQRVGLAILRPKAFLKASIA